MMFFQWKRQASKSILKIHNTIITFRNLRKKEKNHMNKYLLNSKENFQMINNC